MPKSKARKKKVPLPRPSCSRETTEQIEIALQDFERLKQERLANIRDLVDRQIQLLDNRKAEIEANEEWGQLNAYEFFLQNDDVENPLLAGGAGASMSEVEEDIDAIVEATLAQSGASGSESEGLIEKENVFKTPLVPTTVIKRRGLATPLVTPKFNPGAEKELIKTQARPLRRDSEILMSIDGSPVAHWKAKRQKTSASDALGAVMELPADSLTNEQVEELNEDIRKLISEKMKLGQQQQQAMSAKPKI